ncbi:putative cytokinetic ring protein SteA [Demequina pelophila]|uniref:putative cytokinetic ring protein SteA n=1 Tax=Demequina pelophila TaxID=1638984 RepID=UPI000786438B|nr:putative cytokinetic ring protein SteA [Demequina pelophila]
MTAQTTSALTGPARVAPTTAALLRRLRPGDVAIIDALDLDSRTARALAAHRPAAVVNARASVSGRFPSTGARTLLEAGIPLIDAAGHDVLGVRDGAAVEIVDGTVRIDGADVATGMRLTREAAEDRMREAASDLHVHVASFTANALAVLERDADLLLDGVGLPSLRVPVLGRAVVIVTPRAGEPDRALRRFVRERRPIVIGVGEGADIARAAGISPRIIVGDVEALGEETLRRATQVIVHDPEGAEAGLARAQAIGLTHDVADASLASEDLAVLAAYAGGASVIVVAGGREGLLDFVEDRSTTAGAALLTRLRAAGVVVDGAVLPHVYRHRYSGWTVGTALTLATGALGLALWGTPEVRDALVDGWSWLTGLLG